MDSKGTVLTYDIKRNHVEIKKKMKALGWRDTLKSKTEGGSVEINFYMPNTTLYHPTKTPRQGYDEFVGLTTQENIERVMAFAFDGWQGQVGLRHTE